jgi:multidrug efflux pump subunit AcrA (membrane-fusion protein)
MSENNDPKISSWKLILAAMVLVGVIVAAALAGYIPRQQRETAARAAAGEMKASLPVVTATVVKHAPEKLDIVLPGTTSALVEASLFARASGYVSRRYADMGDRVKEGQLLAEIETPELDQQAAQARALVAQARQQVGQVRAALLQAQAQRDLAKITWQRYSGLVEKGAVARQEADTQEASYKTTEALVAQQEANLAASDDNVQQAQASLDRIMALLEFRKVKAPFAGVVTARNVEAGSLISATGAGQGASPQPGTPSNSGGNELYRVAQIGTLRILTSVPQSSMPWIAVGMPAAVAFNELPGPDLEGRVVRMSNAMDPNSRTMLVEIHVANRNGRLFPGMYATVTFHVHRPSPPLLVPGESLIAGNNGLQVAVLHDSAEGNKQVHLQTVTTGRDYGTETEVVEGVAPGDMIVVGPGDDIREGVVVKAEMANQGRGPANSAPNGANRK